MAMSNHNVIYAGTGEGFFNADQIDGTGIWKSTDKGANWEQLSNTANNINMQNITRIIVDPSDENILLFLQLLVLLYCNRILSTFRYL